MGVTGKEIQSRLNFFILSGDTLGFQSKVFHLKDPLLSEGGGGAKIIKPLYLAVFRLYFAKQTYSV